MFIGSFITYLRVERGSSSHTLKAYETDLRMYADFLVGLDESLTLADSDSDLVRRWMADMMDKGCAASSVCRKLSSLRAFFAYMMSKGEMRENPALSVRAPKRGKSLPVFVREEEVDALLESSSEKDAFIYNRNRTVFACFYELGLRRSELCGLNLCDVYFSENQVKVCGKRNKQRIIPFGTGLRAMLMDYIEFRGEVASDAETALFVSSRGCRISQSQVYRMVREGLSRVSTVKRKGPHTLRHTFATVMMNHNAELGAVKELLGHEQLTTTEIYAHVTFEDMKRVYKKAHPRAE